MNCIFCAISPQAYILEDDHFYVIPDKFPVTDGHSLIISKRHVQNYFDLSPEEASALQEICAKLRVKLDQEQQPEGYNLMMNCGKKAGQSIFHFHMHVIPRYSSGPVPPFPG